MSFSCKHQIYAGFICCKAQKGCPPVACPNNVEDCPVYKMNNNNESRN